MELIWVRKDLGTLFMMMENQHYSIEDELDALTDMLTLSLQNTNDPDFYG